MWRVPWLQAPTVGTLFIEFVWLFDESFAIRVTVALDGKAIVDVVTLFEEGKEILPQLPALASVPEGVEVPNHNEGIASPREENVEPFWGEHEPDVVFWVASGERHKDNVAFLPLVIVYGEKEAVLTSTP